MCSDLGAHVDGFIAVVAHSLVIGATKDNKVTGRKADVLLAAHHASQAALRLLKPGNEVKTKRNRSMPNLIQVELVLNKDQRSGKIFPLIQNYF
jgi:ribosomal protein L28